MKRIFLIVLDSFGIGAMPDSEKFGDVGVNTLASCATSDQLHIPNMIAAGLGNIDGVTCLPKVDAPTGAVCRLARHTELRRRFPGGFERRQFIRGIVQQLPQLFRQQSNFIFTNHTVTPFAWVDNKINLHFFYCIFKSIKQEREDNIVKCPRNCP